VHIRDVVSGQLMMNLSGHSGPIVAVEFPSLTNLIVTASLDSTTKFWDLNTGDVVDSIMLDAPFRTMATAPDANLLVYGLTDGSLILYDRGRGFEAGRWRGHSDYINSIAFVAGGPPPRVVSVADDNSMRLWEMNPFTNNLTDWITNNRYVRPIACSETAELSIDIDCEDILLNSEESPNEPGF
jgi:WD40 repeat protein